MAGGQPGALPQRRTRVITGASNGPPPPAGPHGRSPAAPTAGRAPTPRPSGASRAPLPRRPPPRRRPARVEEPGDRGDQAGQCSPVHMIGPAEVADHLGDRAAGARVSFVVRQLQVRHHGAVLVPPPWLSQVHAYQPSRHSSPRLATRPNSCAYAFPGPRHVPTSLTRRNDRDQALMCLRTAEVGSSTGGWISAETAIDSIPRQAVAGNWLGVVQFARHLTDSPG